MLIGLDLSPGLPFIDAGAYFPGWRESPPDAKALWRLVDDLSGQDTNLSVNGFLGSSDVARYFRQHGGRLGDRFGARGAGRLRVVERRMHEAGHGSPSSCFNLVGAGQVGKSSLTGMRVLHALRDLVPVWPFDGLPTDGPVIVEVYPKLAALAAKVPSGLKIRNASALEVALAHLGSPNHAALARYPDDATDAIVTAAWLRTVAYRSDLWSPWALTPAVARTEGWTFGVP